MIFIYTAQIQRKFSNAPYNSKFFTILKSNLKVFNNSQMKSNVGFWAEGKTVPIGIPITCRKTEFPKQT